MSEYLGFLTVIDQPAGGLTGGYLVLNKAGRPMEFHCTVPLSPGKIQHILYGNTLQPFLYGERIAQTLLQRSKLPILSILTNLAAVLPVQPLISIPVIYVFEEQSKPKMEGTLSDDDSTPPVREICEELNNSLKTFGIDDARLRTKSSDTEEVFRVPCVPGLDTGIWREVRICNRRIALPETAEEQLMAEIKERARTIDLLEPFARIRLALEEARNAA